MNSENSLYKLFEKQSGNFLGLFSLNRDIELEQFDFKDTMNTDAKITIRLDFTPCNDLHIRSHHSYFQACYISKPFVNIEPRASISTHNPFNIGGLELNPHEIRGQRVGGMIMYQIFQWLKQFPLDTEVNPIDFVPSGNPKVAKNFYERLGVPTNGDTFTIGDLILHESWKKNISAISQQELFDEIVLMKQEIAGAIEQHQAFRSQISEISKIQYTTNPWIGFKSCHILPNILNQLPDPIDTASWPKSAQGLIELYIETYNQVKSVREEKDRLLKVFDEFNEYKQPRNQWRNFWFALTGFFKAHTYTWIMIILTVYCLYTLF